MVNGIKEERRKKIRKQQERERRNQGRREIVKKTQKRNENYQIRTVIVHLKGKGRRKEIKQEKEGRKKKK